MTLDELCECDAATLEAMSDAQLLEHFQKYLTVTRPELAPKPKVKPTLPMVYLSPQKQKHLALLEAEGVDISFAYKRKKL